MKGSNTYSFSTQHDPKLFASRLAQGKANSPQQGLLSFHMSRSLVWQTPAGLPPMCRFQSAAMFHLSFVFGFSVSKQLLRHLGDFALQKFLLLAHLKRKKSSKLRIRAHIPKRTQAAGSEEGLRPVSTQNALKWPCPPLACFAGIKCPIVPWKHLHLELWGQTEGKLPSPPLPSFDPISLFLFNLFAFSASHQK